ncbi:hypothetical protein LTR17_005619 [Elasticomyces elasticus]|nr:hypothetical protein LTR17_005619 [Elasticomyces elasticus]
MAGWSVFRRDRITPLEYDGDQNLGSKIGKIDIRCTFVAKDSKWTLDNETSKLFRIMYFNFEFNEDSIVPLRSGTVQIDIGSPNERPIPILKGNEPSSAITSAMIEQHIHDSRTTDPQLELTSSLGGGKISGRKHGVDKETVEEHRWHFKAGYPSSKNDTKMTKADFTWRRTLLEDHSGSNRFYTGAVILSREYKEPDPKALKLRVRVEAQPWKAYHRIIHSGAREKTSDLIGYPSTLKLADSEFRLLQSELEADVVAKNVNHAPRRVPKFKPVDLPEASRSALSQDNDSMGATTAASAAEDAAVAPAVNDDPISAVDSADS